MEQNYQTKNIFCNMLWCFALLTAVHASIVFESGLDTFPLYDGTNSLTELFVDVADWPGVVKAANDLVIDFGKVTSNNDSLQLVDDSVNFCNEVPTIVVGTIGKSSLIDELIIEEELDVSEIEGKWESYVITTIDSCNTLVIAGSDKRGTIYGIYSISEQIGVSPWYFWGDVPAESHDEIYFNSSSPVIQGEPSVKYRGVFINDEEPSLTNWVNENFEEGEFTHFVHEFYVHVFELLLRQKANLLWPAMWAAMFGVDDPQNQYWADYYGVVMSTSHTEPLQRATNEWLHFGDGDWDYTTNKENITEFWKKGIARGKAYEGVWTEGMRGFGDRPLSSDEETELLEEIIAHQRDLLVNGFGNGTNISTIPQVWCLYKEVEEYYEEGMSVPDDIILLWTDDNWGNVRRLPVGNETSRPGGAGIYYHFDYVGDPRDYKWINTASFARTWEQLHVVHERQANDLWIVNVGDLKGQEIPISFFFDLGYNFDKYNTPDSIFQWTKDWSRKQFGGFVDDQSTVDEIADILDTYSFLASRRKYELLNSTLFSVINYNEAANVLKEWADLSNRAWNVYNNSLDDAAKPAFFEMILHPSHAGYIVYDMYISAAKNEYYLYQKRNQANYAADHVRQTFHADNDWRITWDNLLEGKWKHMMDQTHLGFTYWQQPLRNSMPPVGELILDMDSLGGSAAVAVDQSMGVVPGDDAANAVSYDNNTIIMPQLDPFLNQTWIEVFSRGAQDFEFTVTPWNDYVKVTPSSGKISATNESIWNSVFVNVSVDFTDLDEGSKLEYINVTTNVSQEFYELPIILFLPINNTKIPDNKPANSSNGTVEQNSTTPFKGFVESQGYISILAEHFTANTSQNGTYYTVLDNFGLYKSGVTLFPINSDTQSASEDSSYLEYDLYCFTGSNVTNITTMFSPSLSIDPKRPLTYAIAIDDEEPQLVELYNTPSIAGSLPDEWEPAVAKNAWEKSTSHDIGPGKHKMKIWLLEVNMALQKVVVDFGGVKESYFGPPESFFYE